MHFHRVEWMAKTYIWPTNACQRQRVKLPPYCGRPMTEIVVAMLATKFPMDAYKINLLMGFLK